MVEKLPRISAALNGGDESRGKTVDTLFAPTDKAIENFLSWTRAQNKTEEFAKILGNQTVAGAIVAYHVLPELVYKFGTLKAFDRKFINTLYRTPSRIPPARLRFKSTKKAGPFSSKVPGRK